jgi:hypothetical protein
LQLAIHTPPLHSSALSPGNHQVFDSTGANIAIHKTASASSLYRDSNPQTAVNGDASVRSDDKTIFHGGHVNSDWWMVDLGKELNVRSVVYYNRLNLNNRMNGGLLQLLNDQKVVISQRIMSADHIQTFSWPMAQARVTLFIDCEFSSTSTSLGLGNFKVNQIGLPGDQISSVRVPSGLQLTLYERADFTGASLNITSDVSCLADRWNGRIGSLRVLPLSDPPLTVVELTPDTPVANPLESRPTFVSSPHPAAVFDRASKQFINFGPLDFSPGVTGMSLISAFSFTGSPGNWERIIDFGNGPDDINFVLAREGTSNNLVFQMLRLPGIIQPNKIIVSVVTYVVFDATYRTNALLTLHQVHRVRLQRRSQVVGQRPFGGRVDPPFDCPPNHALRKNIRRPQQLERRRFPERERVLLIRSQHSALPSASHRQIQRTSQNA